MKTIKITSLLLILFGIFGLPSCRVDSCDGVDFDSFRYFDTQDIQLYAFPKGRAWQEILQRDTLEFDSLGGIYVDFITEYIASKNNSWQLSNPFLSASYACSVIPGYGGSKDEQLEKLEVISLDFWNTQYPAGSSMNNMLRYKGNSMSEEEKPLQQFLREQTGLLQQEDIKLGINQAPQEGGTYRIRVDLAFTSGEAYSKEIQLILE